MINILSRWTFAVIYHSETATTIAEAAAEAVRTGADLIDADLTGADLTGAHLTGAHLIGAHLTGAHLTGADLIGADLTGARLIDADLTGAHLIDADLTGADLTGADLTGAHLIGAHLTGAHLTGADLIGADLTGADRLCLSGSAHPIRAAQNGRVSIGCEVHLITEWLGAFQTIGAEHGYSDAQIEEYGRLLLIAKAWIDQAGGAA